MYFGVKPCEADFYEVWFLNLSRVGIYVSRRALDRPSLRDAAQRSSLTSCNESEANQHWRHCAVVFCLKLRVGWFLLVAPSEWLLSSINNGLAYRTYVLSSNCICRAAYSCCYAAARLRIWCCPVTFQGCPFPLLQRCWPPWLGQLELLICLTAIVRVSF